MVAVVVALAAGGMTTSPPVVTQGPVQQVTMACDARDLAAFAEAESETYGVTADNPVHPKTGEMAAIKDLWVSWLPLSHGRNWSPLHQDKQALCGRVHDFKYFDLWGTRELDWNLLIIPDRAFADLLELPKLIPGAKLNQFLDCAADADCLEAEVTPEGAFVDTVHFPRRGASPLKGQSVCTYGPWVAEKVHGRRPEIHPVEATWWVGPQTDSRFVAFTRDASRRFDTDDDYRALDGAQKARPWAAAPQDAQVRFAVRAPIGLRTDWSLSQVVPASGSGGSSTVHSLTVGNAPTFTLDVRLPASTGFAAALEQPCIDGQQVRAWARVSGQISRQPPQERTPGFLIVRAGPLVPPPPAPSPSDQSPELEFDVASLRRADVGGRSVVVADARVTGLAPGVTVRGAEMQVLGNAAMPEFTATDRLAGANRLEALPVFQGGVIRLQTTTGLVEIPQNPIGLVAVMEASPVEVTPDPQGWTSIRGALPAELPADLPEGLQVVRVAQWRFRVGGAYGYLRGTEVAVEDDAPVPAELNRALHSGDARTLRLFDSPSPLRAEWRSSAELGALQTRMVEVRGPVTTDLLASFSDRSERLALGSVTATVTDPFGTRAEVTEEAASHAIRAGDVGTLRKGVLQLVRAVNPRLGGSTDGLSRSERLRRGVAESMTSEVATDLVVTFHELRALVRLVEPGGGRGGSASGDRWREDRE